MKLKFTPGFWRGFAGFLIGVIVAWAAAWAFIYNTYGSTSIFIRATSLLVYPIHGFATVLEWLLPDAFLAAVAPLSTTLLLLLYPTVCTLGFWFAGKRQTKKIVIAEVCTAAVVIVFGFISASVA